MEERTFLGGIEVGDAGAREFPSLRCFWRARAKTQAPAYMGCSALKLIGLEHGAVQEGITPPH
jgi:hypothetical protein